MTTSIHEFRLARFGHDLLTRDRAAPVRAELRREMEALESGGQLVVDMDGVGAITPSFADELLGRLLLEVGETTFRARIKLRTSDATVRLLVNRVLAQRAAEARGAGRP